MAKPKTQAIARRTPEGKPAIAPALRNDWATSREVADVVYSVLRNPATPEKKPVGLDPCSNGESIIDAEFSIVQPDGAKDTDLVGGLVAAWHEYDSFYCNPPFGDGVINLWVDKAIAEAKLGAEGIMLLPAYVSSYFFDDIWNAAQVICLWGLPGQTSSRVKFIGAKDSATFPIMLCYFGPRVAHAADILARVGQIIPPEMIKSWLSMIRGDVIPSLRAEWNDDRAQTDPIYVAMRRACLNQYDELVNACASVSDKTLADLSSESHPLIGRLLGLTVGEVVGGLAALQRVELVANTSPSSRKNIKRAPRRKNDPDDDPMADQLELIKVPARQAARETLDRKILSLLLSNYESGLSATETRTQSGATPAQFRSAIERLTKASLITKTGTTADTRYLHHRIANRNQP